MNRFEFARHGKSDTVILFGQTICELDWLYLGQEIELYDKNLKQTFTFSLYQVTIDSQYYTFAASEIANDEWLFYTTL